MWKIRRVTDRAHELLSHCKIKMIMYLGFISIVEMITCYQNVWDLNSLSAIKKFTFDNLVKSSGFWYCQKSGQLTG